MDVPPPVRGPNLPMGRTLRVTIMAVLLGVLLAWSLGRAQVNEWCGVCGSYRRSTEVGLFWDDHRRLALTFSDDVQPSSEYRDTCEAWGHVHTWGADRRAPERLVARLFSSRTVGCGSLTHQFHTEATQAFSSSPEFRGMMAARVAEGTWTVAEVEDAMLWCDQSGCDFSRKHLTLEVAVRRANCYARILLLVEEFTAPRSR